ncbi:DUF3006 family protein [Halomicroarcula sp. GCM10025709]|uniref:DUF3006 family protein n=1 Tax=Haloarcula TaxID=2237 RepID=UPI0024C2287B|nr:DUF3006 family protein [Halomicroarcula sp. YJ-61-S]
MSETIDLDDGVYTAVVDTIEDGFATVFFERDGSEVGHAVLEEATVPDAARQDTIFAVEIESGSITDWESDADTTESRQDAAQSRFDRLSSRPPSDEES